MTLNKGLPFPVDFDRLTSQDFPEGKDIADEDLDALKQGFSAASEQLLFKRPSMRGKARGEHNRNAIESVLNALSGALFKLSRVQTTAEMREELRAFERLRTKEMKSLRIRKSKKPQYLKDLDAILDEALNPAREVLAPEAVVLIQREQAHEEVANATPELVVAAQQGHPASEQVQTALTPEPPEGHLEPIDLRVEQLFEEFREVESMILHYDPTVLSDQYDESNLDFDRSLAEEVGHLIDEAKSRGVNTATFSDALSDAAAELHEDGGPFDRAGFRQTFALLILKYQLLKILLGDKVKDQELDPLAPKEVETPNDLLIQELREAWIQCCSCMDRLPSLERQLTHLEGLVPPSERLTRCPDYGFEKPTLAQHLWDVQKNLAAYRAAYPIALAKIGIFLARIDRAELTSRDAQLIERCETFLASQPQTALLPLRFSLLPSESEAPSIATGENPTFAPVEQAPLAKRELAEIPLVTLTELESQTNASLVQKKAFEEGRGWFEAMDQLMLEYDFDAPPGTKNQKFDLLFRYGMSHFRKHPFDLYDPNGQELSGHVLQARWLEVFRKLAQFEKWTPVKKERWAFSSPRSLVAMGAFTAMAAFVAGMISKNEVSPSFAPDLAQASISVSSQTLDPAVEISSQTTAPIAPAAAPSVADSMPAWDHVKKLGTTMSMAQILADPRVVTYLNENSKIAQRLDSPKAYAAIKAELLEDGGFGGAFGFAPNATTLNEYDAVVRPLDAKLADRIWSEMLMFGLSPEQVRVLNSKIDEVVNSK